MSYSPPEETQEALRSDQSARPSLPDTGDEMTKLDARLEIIETFERWRTGQDLTLVAALKVFASEYKPGVVSDDAMALIPKLAWNTLQRWRNTLKSDGSAALACGTGGRRSILDTNPDMANAVIAQLYERWPHITAQHVRRILAVDFHDRKLPGVRAIQRWINNWIKRNSRSLSAVTNPDGHRSRLRPAFGSAASDITEPNQLWELDSTRIDLMCADGKRHSLVAAIDVWTRRARVVVAPQSNSAAIAALIRRCILDWGVPAQVATDEGADYKSNHLRRVFADLEIAQLILPPYSPEKKPFVERFIGTISRDLFSQLPGFVGHCVADREAIQSRQSFAGRRGQDRTVTFSCSLDTEQLQDRIDSWCDHLYARSPHSGLGGQTPFARAASWHGVRREVDPRGLDILLAKPVSGDTRQIQKTGISVEGGRYIAAGLGDLVGETVHVRLDPTDYGRIHVFREGRFVCVAEDPLRTGMDRQSVATEAVARSRRADRDARKLARDLARATEADSAIDRVLSRSQAAASRVVSFPRPGKTHTSEMIEAAAEAAEAASELKNVKPADKRDSEDAGGDRRFLEGLMQHYLEG